MSSHHEQAAAGDQPPVRRQLRIATGTDTAEAELSPGLSAEEVAELFDVVAQEQQTVQELEACWEQLRASYAARDGIQHLTPSEIEAAMHRTRRLLDDEGQR